MHLLLAEVEVNASIRSRREHVGVFLMPLSSSRVLPEFFLSSSRVLHGFILSLPNDLPEVFLKFLKST